MCVVLRKGQRPYQRDFVSVEGLEPSTNGLKGHCSAIELHARIAKCILSRSVSYVNGARRKLSQANSNLSWCLINLTFPPALVTISAGGQVWLIYQSSTRSTSISK